MKAKCMECNKINKSGICNNCGLYNYVTNQMINNAIQIIGKLLKRNNKKIKFYKDDSYNNLNLTLYPRGIKSLFDVIYDEFIEVNIKEMESFIILLSYLSINKNVNISKYAMILFGYFSIYLKDYEKYYFYWSKKAVKSGSYLAIKWVIADYTNGSCSYRKTNKKKVLKLKRLSRNLKLDFSKW